jgi:phage tail-like protein
MSVTTGQLIVRLADNIVQVVPLNLPVITIGRAPDNTLSLSDLLISRRHAEIRVQDGVPVLIDVGSSNGTRVDGERILPNQPYPITTGTVVQVGSYTITYQPEGATPPGDGEQSPIEQTAPLAIVEATPPPPNGHAPLLAALPMRRLTFPMERADGPASRYLRYMPVIYQDNDFMGRFLLIFESIWEPIERRQDQIGMYFNPHTCPPGFLPWIADWLALSINTDWPEQRIRRFIAEAMDLYRWRGTRYGLERMIEVCTGIAPQITEPPGQPFVFQVAMKLPQQTDVDRDLIEQLIVAHKPAHTGYVLEIAE